jgi:hypothetical protein
MRITKEKYGDVLFHLLLPLSAIREQEKDIALNPTIATNSLIQGTFRIYR